MTPYSASRGIRYTAPPGPDGNRRDVEDEEASEHSTAEVEADGGEANGSGTRDAERPGRSSGEAARRASRPSSDANASGGRAEAAADD